MTDVMKKAKSSTIVKQGAAYTSIPLTASGSLFDSDYAYTPVISGVNGAVTNNYLDDRFDDVTYYG